MYVDALTGAAVVAIGILVVLLALWWAYSYARNDTGAVPIDLPEDPGAAALSSASWAEFADAHARAF